ncbi:hypothetical protein NLG97_g8422 [Lecanicillium saksenae]|uniref:Uncharacterized protein n=1 Tax=Lecanicillium saksenae TaxID=468837 RepID=A0ACC1QKK4_9HYPO|nr:hypothetical protein NLG97_g8422 [Lecanicillium saksenae]
MPTNVLITGASGYLGSSFIDAIDHETLPTACTVYASVRNAASAKAVTDAGLVPWVADLRDPDAIAREVVDKEISVVFWLIDVLSVDSQTSFLKALAEVKRKTGNEVHFLQAIETNNVVIEQGEALGVRTYIFVPCIVYGEHQGFGNKISIQNVAIVNAAKAAGNVYKVDTDRPTWPVCHVTDNARLYVAILTKILAGDLATLGHGKQGYYLAAAGSLVWEDLYAAMAAALVRHGAIASAEVPLADDAALEKMAQGLGGGPKEFVRVQLGGRCTFTAEHGARIGWRPRYAPEHIIESADAEVKRILEHGGK